MNTFEYKSVNVEMLDRQLNELGAEGWEMVSYAHKVSRTPSGMRDNIYHYYVFKRTIKAKKLHLGPG